MFGSAFPKVERNVWLCFSKGGKECLALTSLQPFQRWKGMFGSTFSKVEKGGRKNNVSVIYV
jgi:hypothetical protein